ncbi:Asp-tRNA(Asn)/Glu-tRNA(Gln) amidotransferase GatCAB subunit A [Candidatus Pacearchaeota archaeon]|nr:Asp-tRNA(Asn)/Glu-tRNA(Gln) amidotransferase GatCAB subunit A [Candidatus Pacearchaeota archaeon]
MNLKQKVKQIKEGKLSAVENVMQFGEKIKKDNKKLNIFLHLNENSINEAKEIDSRIKNNKKTGKLAGLCVAIKSNICVKHLTINCASKVLEDFTAPYDATVIQKLKAEDAIVIGMVNMDEFACGGSGETSAFGPTKNPENLELIPGGSSSGSAAAVAADFCDFALGSDTGGSIRNPASHCGVVGLKPTYGAVSRYGLLDMTMSFDQIGPLTKTTEDAELVLSVIKGQDNFDSTTQEVNFKGKPRKVLGLVDTADFATPEITKLVTEKAKELAENQNLKIKTVKLPLDISLETYYIMVYTEFFSATRKYDGRRFGKLIDQFGGPEVQRRIIGGSEITKAEFEGKYYREALKARNLVVKEFEKIFKEVDAIILPTVPKLAHKIGEEITIKELYAYDVFTVLANLAQTPGISIPLGKIDNKNIGIQILADKWNEKQIFELAKNI